MFVLCLAAILAFMYFENATGGIHGYYYYVNFAGNSNTIVKLKVCKKL